MRGKTGRFMIKIMRGKHSLRIRVPGIANKKPKEQRKRQGAHNLDQWKVTDVRKLMYTLLQWFLIGQ